MGLDMYIDAKVERFRSYFVGDSDAEKVEYPEDLEVLYDNIVKTNYAYVETIESYGIGYFRKFNALHNYIVNNFADGEDHCQEIVLTEERLTELLNVVSQVNNNHSLASNLLPTQDGFFFGSTEYDEWYFKNVKKAKELFEMILDNLDLEKYTIIYKASW